MLCLGLSQDGDVGGRRLSKVCEEILISRLSLGGVAVQNVGAGKAIWSRKLGLILGLEGRGRHGRVGSA
jgi:hypothetical protein